MKSLQDREHIPIDEERGVSMLNPLSSPTRGFVRVLVAAFVLCGSTFVSAQDPNYVLTHSNEAGLTGASVTAEVTLDNTGLELKGWSYGVCTDPGIVSVDAVITGSTTATVSNGSAPDFESINLFADGFTHGVVICFLGCATLPAGSGYQLVTADYTLVGGPGNSGTACFCDTLGSPAIETLVVDPIGTALVPTQVCGQIDVLDPPPAVSGLSCTASPLTCSCDIAVSWTNGAGDYDSIEVVRDGTLVATLPGSATSYNSADEVGLHSFEVTPIRDSLSGSTSSCSADCPDITVPATPVADLDCTIDPGTCEATVTWTNSSSYMEIVVSVDGVPTVTLAGGATSTLLSLGAGSFEICVSATTVCDDPVVAVCCTVDCGSAFLRADHNADGSINIADPIALLAILFTGAIPSFDCDDALDSNDDGMVNIADAISVLGYLFDDGPDPPAPFEVCGADPTSDSLDCPDFPTCP